MARNPHILRPHFRHCFHQHFPSEMAAQDRGTDPDLLRPRIFAILIPLVYLTPHGSAKDVFVTSVNGGEWSSDGLSWFV